MEEAKKGRRQGHRIRLTGVRSVRPNQSSFPKENPSGTGIKGIYPPLPEADKIQFVPMGDFSKDEYAEKRKEFQKLLPIESSRSGKLIRTRPRASVDLAAEPPVVQLLKWFDRAQHEGRFHPLRAVQFYANADLDLADFHLRDVAAEFDFGGCDRGWNSLPFVSRSALSL